MLTKGNIITKFPLLFISNIIYASLILIVLCLQGDMLGFVLSLVILISSFMAFMSFFITFVEPKYKISGLTSLCVSIAGVSCMLFIPETHIYYIFLASIGILLRSYVLYLSYPLLDTNIYGLDNNYFLLQLKYLVALRKTEEFSKFKAKHKLLKSKDLTKKDYNRMYQTINQELSFFSDAYFSEFRKQYKGVFIKNQTNEEFVQSSKEISDKLEKAFNEL